MSRIMISYFTIRQCEKVAKFLKDSTFFSLTRCSSTQLYERDKPSLVIGTIGDHGHGKTTLSSSITKVLSANSLNKFFKVEDLDKAPLEKEKKITIGGSIFSYQTENRAYSHLDLPGSSKYLKNLITQASSLDSAILVVDSSEGTSNSTKERLLITKQFGVEHLIVFLNKADQTPEDLIKAAESDVQGLLQEIGFDIKNIPIISGSALVALKDDGQAIGKNSIVSLLGAMDKIPSPKRDMESPPLLNILDIFSVPGTGTIVRGKLEKGKINLQDKLVVSGHGFTKEDTVTGLELFRKPVKESIAGDLISVQLKGLKKDQLKRGMVAFKAGTYQVSNTFEAEISWQSDSFIEDLSTRHNLFLRSHSFDSILHPMPQEKKRLRILIPRLAVVEVGQPLILQGGSELRACAKVASVLPKLSDEEISQHFSKKKKK